MKQWHTAPLGDDRRRTRHIFSSSCRAQNTFAATNCQLESIWVCAALSLVCGLIGLSLLPADGLEKYSSEATEAILPPFQATASSSSY